MAERGDDSAGDTGLGASARGADESASDKSLAHSAQPCGPGEDSDKGGGDASKAKDDEVTHTVHLTSVTHEHFVPIEEKNPIGFSISGPLDQVKSLWLEVVSEREPERVIRAIEVDGRLVKKGSGIFDWDGELETSDAVYDESINLNMSPYELKLRLFADSGEYESPEDHKVEVKLTKIAISLEADLDKAGLKDEVKEAVEGLADEIDAGGGSGRLVLHSNVYKRKSDEMKDSSSFAKYRSHISSTYGHPQGPPVPLRAALELELAVPRGSKSASAPLPATYGTRVLWDIKVDPGKRASVLSGDRGLHSEAKSFVTTSDAATHEKADSNPPGDTAHAVFGGMRTSRKDSTSYWFVSDWTLENNSKRKWAGRSLCEESGDFPDSDTGVWFRPGRMGGDSYEIRAYVDKELAFDERSDGKLPGDGAPEKSNKLEIAVWRKLDVAKSWKIGKSTLSGDDRAIGGKSLDSNALGTEYKKTAVIFDASGLVHDTTQDAAYAKWYKSAIEATRKAGKYGHIVDAALDHNPQGHPASFLSWKEYTKKSGRYSGFTGFFRRIADWFRSDEDATYKKECKDAASVIVKQYARKLPVKEDGLYLVKFAGWGIYYANGMDVGTNTVGWAPYIKKVSSRNRALFFVFDNDSPADTLVHEVGHHVFLAHAPGSDNPGQDNPAGYQADAHDAADVCVMSYRDRKNGLCGLCIMKVGGLDVSKTNKQGKVLAGGGP